MIENILKREDVRGFLGEVLSQSKFNQKEIPNTFCEEKITKMQYSLFICLDAIIKYFIIVDNHHFDKFLEQLRRIIKKLNTHNDIVVAVNRLLIKAVKNKLGIKEESSQTKKIIIKYFYDQYIQKGYLFHSFPGCFNINQEKLKVENFYYQFEQLQNIGSILNQYKIENSFSKKFDEVPHISFTDSFFMASFYSYHCPLFLYELSTKLVKNDDTEDEVLNHFFLKNYQKCYDQLDTFLKKKEVPLKDKNKILTFFEEQWQILNATKEQPVVAFIKRNSLEKDSLDHYSSFIDSEESLEDIVSQILDTRYNDKPIDIDINPDFYLKLPNIHELLNQEVKEEEQKKEIKIDNSYGNATIVALFGVLLITLGITLTIMMMGR